MPNRMESILEATVQFRENLSFTVEKCKAYVTKLIGTSTRWEADNQRDDTSWRDTE